MRTSRRGSTTSAQGWFVLNTRHGGRFVFVCRVPDDPVPTRSEVIIKGCMADYEDVLWCAAKDKTGMSDAAVEEAREKVVNAIREAPVKIKVDSFTGVKTPRRPRSFSMPAMLLTTE